MPAIHNYVCSAEAGCNQTFTKFIDLKKHEAAHSPKGYICDWLGCDFATLMKSSYEIHYAKHTGEQRYICPDDGCNYRTHDPALFTRHRKRFHGYVPLSRGRGAPSVTGSGGIQSASSSPQLQPPAQPPALMLSFQSLPQPSAPFHQYQYQSTQFQQQSMQFQPQPQPQQSTQFQQQSMQFQPQMQTQQPTQFQQQSMQFQPQPQRPTQIQLQSPQPTQFHSQPMQLQPRAAQSQLQPIQSQQPPPQPAQFQLQSPQSTQFQPQPPQPAQVQPQPPPPAQVQPQTNPRQPSTINRWESSMAQLILRMNIPFIPDPRRPPMGGPRDACARSN